MKGTTMNENTEPREKLTRIRASAALKIIRSGKPASWLAQSGLMSPYGAAAVWRIVEQYSVQEIEAAA